MFESPASGLQRRDAVRVGEGGRAREGGVLVEIMDSRVVSLWLEGGRREDGKMSKRGGGSDEARS